PSAYSLGTPAGFSGQAGAGNLYASAPLSAVPGDHLSSLIQGLGGSMAGARSGMGALPEPLRTHVAPPVRHIPHSLTHGLLTAAIEECLRVMEGAPQYLDVHLMLAEIYVRQGKIEQEIAKYAMLIDMYAVNGRGDDAIATYRRILQLEPNNLNYRVKLI